jgi:hypothetical protein
VSVREVHRRGEARLVGAGLGREEHDVRELRGEADLAQAPNDVVQAGRRGLGWVARAGRAQAVGHEDEVCGPDPEPGQSRGAGAGREELVLQRGQRPAGIRERQGWSWAR